ncbi:MAG: FAD-binding domain-containing protein [Bacteroidia bacterium]
MEKIKETFATEYTEILTRIDQIEPIKYGQTRNFIDGAVTRLSPYISRGVISTAQVLEITLNRGFNPWEIKKFIQELAWRDYWQQVWIARSDEINEDLKQPQSEVTNFAMPQSIIEGNTGVQAIDDAISAFDQTGYLHNHLRMYIASMACNMGKSHWKVPAKWMYYHLLDGDWASNALSWQWVCGANSNKKYFANQENINTYCYTNQQGTFLDVPYDYFSDMDIPEALEETALPELTVILPESERLQTDSEKPTLIYNFYNLDPQWHSDWDANRILLLEPSVFHQYPVSPKSIEFILKLSQNIPGIRVYTGEFWELEAKYGLKGIYYKEHPLNKTYRGTKESRDWMFKVTGYYPSFFAFWKKCEKEMQQW